MIQKNEFVEKEDHIEVILVNKKKIEVARALIDKEDAEKVAALRWCANKRHNNYYVRNNKVGDIHRFIMSDAPKGKVIDHINRNPLDNRKRNLRYISQKENLRNCSVQKRSKSGQKGVNVRKVGKGGWKITVKIPNTTRDAYNSHFAYEDLDLAIKKAQELRVSFGLSAN